MSTPAPLASIVIPHYGRRELTWSCYDAVERGTSADHEVIVVDNGTGHDLPGTVLRNRENRGFAVACNQGAEAAAAPVVVFLNNDTEPRPGWLEALLVALERPAVVAASPRIVNPDGSLQSAGDEVVRHHNGQIEVLPSTVDRPGGPVRLATAACLAVSREAFRAVGGFDEGYWNGLEDVDLCLALEAAGGVIFYEPQAVVMHHGAASGPERWRAVQQNVARLAERWGHLTPDRHTTWGYLARSWVRHRVVRPMTALGRRLGSGLSR